MIDHYFNYSTHLAVDWWTRQSFLRQWCRIYASDRRWTPPPYWQFRRMLLSSTQPMTLLHLEALPRRHAPGGFGGAVFEEPVAAVAILTDPRERARDAYLSFLHCVNDEEALERLWGAVAEQLWAQGIQRVLGPIGPSPFLQSGVLQNFFHVTPPLHTAYNPPYLPDLCSTLMEPWLHTQLYVIDCALNSRRTGEASQQPTGLEITPLKPARLAGDLLGLWQAACLELGSFPPLETAEATLLLKWLATWPLSGWVAERHGTPLGFVLLQPDLAPSVRRAWGGRNPLWHWWLQWRSRQRCRAGRVLYGAVLPQWRGQGIGHALWQQVLQMAQSQGWKSLTVGPLPADSSGAKFIIEHQGRPQQKYIIYSSEL
ncbi:MAG: GNAT family N-acetyltransferase [Caldilineaceae bacterium]